MGSGMSLGLPELQLIEAAIGDRREPGVRRRRCFQSKSVQIDRHLGGKSAGVSPL